MTRIRKNGEPDRRYGRKGERPDRWRYGPDPLLHQLHVKFLRSRVQARYWRQEWQLTFDQFAAKYQEAGVDPFRPARSPDSINLCRLDKDGAWSVENTVMRYRADQMRREKTRDANGQTRRRRPRNAG